MPMIYVNDGEDHLKRYKKWRKMRWYKRISRQQWFMMGIGVGLTGLLAPAAYSLVSGWIGGGLNFGFGG